MDPLAQGRLTPAAGARACGGRWWSPAATSTDGGRRSASRLLPLSPPAAAARSDAYVRRFGRETPVAAARSDADMWGDSDARRGEVRAYCYWASGP